MPKPKDPETPTEWQDAVDAAYACANIEAARAYGLVTGGPKIDLKRCEEILSIGKSLGIQPKADAIERFVRAVNSPR